MLVYLFELDSVRNSKAEIIKGQQALFEEIVMNGNQVVLSFNQLTDSEAFLSILENEEAYEEMIGLFRCGALRVSQFGRFRTAWRMKAACIVKSGEINERLIPAVKKGAIVSIPVYDDKFVLLKQYRHAMRAFQYAFPRGFGEEGLSAGENLQKEIKEETGADVKKISHVGTVIADSGIGSNEVDVFACEITEPQLKLHYEGIEEIELLTEKELIKWIAEGRITDGFTLSGYALYRSRKSVITEM